MTRREAERMEVISLCVNAGWAAARMAAEQFEQIEKESTMQTSELRPVEAILQDEAGCAYHQALLISDAQGAAHRAYENFRFDKEFPADLLAALALIKDARVKV